MIQAQLNFFDCIVIAVLVLSTTVAFFRGFVKEILSLGAWVGAGILTVYAFPSVAAMLKANMKSSTVAIGLASLGTYMMALMLISLFNMVIYRYLKPGNDVGMLDNALGLFFGLLRGIFIVSLGFLLMTFVMSEENYPPWVKEARTRKMAESGAMVLASLAPKYLLDISTLNEKVKARREERLSRITKGDKSDPVDTELQEILLKKERGEEGEGELAEKLRERRRMADEEAKKKEDGEPDFMDRFIESLQGEPPAKQEER